MSNLKNSAADADSHLPWLDWMRFLAAFAVMLSHVHGAVLVRWGDMANQDKTMLAGGILAFCSFGQEAVLAFFVMSGMLVGGRLLERLLKGRFEVGRYAVDRFTRIYVPLVPALAFSAGVWLWLGNSIDLWQVLGNFAQLQGVFCRKFEGNAVLWSLSYEFWFYVMAGAFAAICLGRGRGKLPALILFAVCLAIFAKLDPVYLFCWALGALAYLCRRVATHPSVLYASLALIALGMWLSSPIGIADRAAMAYRANFLLICLGISLFAIAIVNRSPGERLKGLESLGARFASGSYTLYLVHAPVVAIYHRMNPELNRRLDGAAIVDSLACIALCLAVTWVFYHLFERHTAKVRSWVYRISGFNHNR